MTSNVSTELVQLIDTAIDKWLAVNTPAEITKSVTKKLNEHKDEITLKLLGFDKSYGNRVWSLDHCNGRSGNSPAGEYLKATQSAVVKQWLENVPLPELTPTLLSKISSEFNDMYLRALKKELFSLAEEKAKKDSQKILDEVISTDSVENYLKTKELIQS